MKKFFAAVVLSLASFAAMAMPSPQQIEVALKHNDINSARSMVQEVLREKPESAKAHLFHAYILAKQGDRSAAANELQTAGRLDHNGSVKNSALFGRTATMLEAPVAPMKASNTIAAAVAPVVPYSTPVAAPVYADKPSAFWGFVKFLFWMTVIGLIIYVAYYWYNKKKKAKEAKEYKQPSTYYASGSNDVPASTHSSGLYNSAPSRSYSKPESYEAPVRSREVVHAAPASGGTTIVNNGSHGGSGDMVTGLMLGHMMSGHGSHHHHDHGHSHGSNHSSASASAPTPVAAPAVDYDSRSSSFSSGNGDSWTSSRSSASPSRDDSWTSSRSSSASSDDDWNNRSSSSSSSSSSLSWDSDSSSSSYDSGSSGGSDW